MTSSFAHTLSIATVVLLGLPPPEPPSSEASRPPPAAQVSAANEGSPVVASPDSASRLYVVGPGDSVQLRVIGHDEFDTTTEVSTRNTLIVPILGEVPVRGATVEQLQARVTAMLRDGYLADPQVLVDVLDYSNMLVWAFGFVNQPGEHRLRGPTRVLQMLDVIGSLRSGASDMLIIERKTDRGARRTSVGDEDDDSDAEPQTIRVDLRALLRDGDLSQNVALQHGDKLYVPPQSAKVYAFGEVRNPGFYAHHEGMKLTDLIQVAGGFTDYANTKKIKIRRENENKEIRVNMKDYYKNGALDENLPLTDGDTVIVGSSFFF